MNFFEQLWNLQTQKWNLFVDYWYIWAIGILALFALGFFVSRKK